MNEHRKIFFNTLLGLKNFDGYIKAGLTEEKNGSKYRIAVDSLVNINLSYSYKFKKYDFGVSA